MAIRRISEKSSLLKGSSLRANEISPQSLPRRASGVAAGLSSSPDVIEYVRGPVFATGSFLYESSLCAGE